MLPESSHFRHSFCRESLAPPWMQHLEANGHIQDSDESVGGWGLASGPSLALPPGQPCLPVGVTQQQPLLLRPSVPHK